MLGGVAGRVEKCLAFLPDPPKLEETLRAVLVGMLAELERK